MKKKIVPVILSILVFSAIWIESNTVSAENKEDIEIIMNINNPVMRINNQSVNIDENGTLPIISNGTTLVPVRAVTEALGGSINWDNTAKTVSITKDNIIIELVIDNTIAKINGNSVQLDTAPVVVNGRTMLPLRFVAENMGADVDWNGEKREITIKSKAEISTSKTAKDITEITNNDGKYTINEDSTNEEKTLIVYFTLPETDGVDTVAGASRVILEGELYGNMEFMANIVQKTVGGNKFEIKTVQEYPTIHKPLVDLADEELENNARPELLSHIDNFDNYDTFYIGYPIWWGDMPMPLYSFFEEYDFSGKTIIPFSSHGGSRLSGTVEKIKELEPNADVEDGFTVSRDNIASDSKSVSEEFTEWLKNFK